MKSAWTEFYEVSLGRELEVARRSQKLLTQRVDDLGQALQTVRGKVSASEKRLHELRQAQQEWAQRLVEFSRRTSRH